MPLDVKRSFLCLLWSIVLVFLSNISLYVIQQRASIEALCYLTFFLICKWILKDFLLRLRQIISLGHISWFPRPKNIPIFLRIIFHLFFLHHLAVAIWWVCLSVCTMPIYTNRGKKNWSLSHYIKWESKHWFATDISLLQDWTSRSPLAL